MFGHQIKKLNMFIEISSIQWIVYKLFYKVGIHVFGLDWELEVLCFLCPSAFCFGLSMTRLLKIINWIKSFAKFEYFIGSLAEVQWKKKKK